jgi:oligopeptide/dipeptide ABC transporter ATP-binding protein
MDKYPRELSGGERQRVAIARGLVLNPSFVIADEPCAMLDMSIRSGIMDLLAKLKKELGLTLLYITHDISISRYMTEMMSVMYLGKIVETGPTEEAISKPLHPYTQLLISSVPSPDPNFHRERLIDGSKKTSSMAISSANPPRGCRFHPRCNHVMQVCETIVPAMFESSKGHFVACHLYSQLT